MDLSLLTLRCSGHHPLSQIRPRSGLPTAVYFGDALKKAVESGQVSESLLDDKLIRRFRTMMRLGVWDQQPARGDIPKEHAEIAMKLAAEGAVLLKNDPGQLPLNSNAIHSIALIGPFADQAMTGGGGSSHVNPILTVSPLEGIKKVVALMFRFSKMTEKMSLKLSRMLNRLTQ